MSNKEILFHCAPTLANVKIGNIFTVRYEEESKLRGHVSEKNTLMNEKGVFVEILRISGNTALIYVYRKNKLVETLEKAKVKSFLSEFQYDFFDVDSAISVLKCHLQKDDFPHEIGVFLGYPLEDIRGFIENSGKNSFHTGCWKVYHNPENALKKFAQYKKCIKIYLECYAQGFDMNRLTVAG